MVDETNTTEEQVITPTNLSETARQKPPIEPLPDLQRIRGLLSVENSASIKARSPRKFSQQLGISNDGGTTKLWIYIDGNWTNITTT